MSGIIDWTELERVARAAAGRAYCPYSKFRVGAALLADDWTVFSGSNIENASYGATVCAERVALFRAVAEGRRKFIALALSAGRDIPATPCGMCLQVLTEFCPADLPIRCFTAQPGGQSPLVFTLSELLPHMFSSLQADRDS